MTSRCTARPSAPPARGGGGGGELLVEAPAVEQAVTARPSRIGTAAATRASDVAPRATARPATENTRGRGRCAVVTGPVPLTGPVAGAPVQASGAETDAS